MREMQLKHIACRSDYDKIVGTIDDRKDIYQICRQLWTFCRTNLTYVVEDGEAQYVSCPYTILRGGNVDCKNYALFIAGMLDALKRKGYPLTWTFRYASYRIFKTAPDHVFVVVNPDTDNIWVDPVLNYFNYHLRYFHHRDKKPRAAASLGRIGGGFTTTDFPTGSITDFFALGPPADLHLPGPVAEGTKNAYGTATWIPDNYPTKTQPYLYNGRLILRPLNTDVNLGTETPYIMAALQVAISRYSQTPYSILYSNSLGSAPARIRAQLIMGVNPNDLTAKGEAGQDNWLPLPPQPSGLDKILNTSATWIPQVVAAGINLFVPGLGTAVLVAVNAAANTKLGAPAENTQLIANLANQSQQTSISSILSSSIIPGVKNVWLLAALGLLIIYDIS